jgi:hypothetical protein
MRPFRKSGRGRGVVLAAFISVLIPTHLLSQTAGEPVRSSPIDVAGAYLRTVYARDPQAAYRHISSADRTVRDETTYIRSQVSFGGFALKLAQRFASEMQVWSIEQKLGPKHARLKVGYLVPSGDEIAPQLLDWNPDKLNQLSEDEQRRLLDAVDRLIDRPQKVTIEGRETIDLVREKHGWRIFLDWRSRARILFKAVQPRSGELVVRFLRNDFLLKTGDPFQIDLTVTNRTGNDLIVKLDHLFEPRSLAESIDMIACGSLAPFHLRPHAVQSISSHYVFSGRGSKPAPLSIIYHFTAQPAVVKKDSFLDQIP